ncbi:MAG: 16S rRNA (cytosine(967)-C(5))-methyltransferase [Candidatus Melainabacteria bacterium GWF2_32_7]|nr:MAG: 16S rRNA (cytosine(967)-C(5))-methyltransferase [Candidatus Melainabacteria bacterium GWF2_32_7]
MDVRQVALKALIKIIEKSSQADEILNFYSGKVIFPSELKNLVSGVVKHKLTLDFFIQNISTKKLKDLSYEVKNALRLAIYELEYLHTPDYAVINSYVELVKQYDKKSGAFVNGVLRNFIRKRSEINFPDAEKNPVYAFSIKYSHPEWMIARWIHNYGIEDTRKICKYNNLAPKLVIRVNTLKISKPKLMDFFIHNNVSFSDDRIVDECMIIHHHNSIKSIPGFEEGYWTVQSESSSLVSIILDPKENESILDLCAAPGGKTTHIAAIMNNKGKITAVDINPKRLEKVKDNCLRLGVKSVNTKAADATQYVSEEKYDKVLVDAPCSNTGVLIKRIDARWRKSPEDIQNLAKLQLGILNNAAKLVKNNGIIVYSTCSIEPEENNQVIEKFLESNKDFKPDKIAPYLSWTIQEDKGYFQILQSRQNIDGFFIARLRKI